MAVLRTRIGASLPPRPSSSTRAAARATPHVEFEGGGRAISQAGCPVAGLDRIEPGPRPCFLEGGDDRRGTVEPMWPQESLSCDGGNELGRRHQLAVGRTAPVPDRRVTADRTGHVVRLVLDSNSLTGRIPPEITRPVQAGLPDPQPQRSDGSGPSHSWATSRACRSRCSTRTHSKARFRLTSPAWRAWAPVLGQ